MGVVCLGISGVVGVPFGWDAVSMFTQVFF